MGAAALTARIPLLSTRTSARAACGLAFDEPGGPLVAVCGLVGGAGTSTLAYLLARQAARESRATVLLTESDGTRAGLAVVAGRAGPLSLQAVARDVAEGCTPNGTVAELEPRLGLLACLPTPADEAAPEQLRALLCEARAVHGLVVVDCGTRAGAVVGEATHVIWTVSASRSGFASAQLLLAGRALPAPGRSREILVATSLPRGNHVSVRALRRLAAQRCERLVLIPHSEAVARGELRDEQGTIFPALAALAPILRRVR